MTARADGLNAEGQEARLAAGLAQAGLEILARAPLEPGEAPAPWRAVLLVGPSPAAFWPVFQESAEAADGAAHPIDRWSRRIGADLAGACGLEAVFPFGGPPYAPFVAWALRSGAFHPSPAGPLLHVGGPAGDAPARGLWASFRMGFLTETPTPAAPARPSPCADCPRPCVAACPVSAVGPDGFDADRCAEWAGSWTGAACRSIGCRMRAVCPIAPEAAPQPARAAHHMAAFLAGRRAARERTAE